MYELAWDGGFFGACHALDLPLVFGNFHSPMAKALLEPSPAAEQLSKQFRTAWTTFAATGDPGWPSYDTHERTTRVFDAEPLVTAYPEEASRRLWQDHVFRPLPLL
jgi:para-nitrobenzyl esterase